MCLRERASLLGFLSSSTFSSCSRKGALEKCEVHALSPPSSRRKGINLLGARCVGLTYFLSLSALRKGLGGKRSVAARPNDKCYK